MSNEVLENNEKRLNKVDFIFTIEVNNANPNGDPLMENMPRIDGNGYGMISDVCIKRKIRNRMQDLGEEIFIKSAEREDEYASLEEKFIKSIDSIGKDVSGKDDSGKDFSDKEVASLACKKWLDIRTFGHVVTYKKAFESKSGNRSIGIRGPVSISIAKSILPITITSMQITKSVNGQQQKEGKIASDTMGMKHFVEHAVYIVTGSVNSYIASKTGFNEKDLEILKECISTLFENDASSARPDGSMIVRDLYWITHSSPLGDMSSAKLRSCIKYVKDEDKVGDKYEDYKIEFDDSEIDEKKIAVLHLSLE